MSSATQIIMEWLRKPVTLSALLVLVFVLFVQTVRAWLRLRHIPGPISARFSKAWLLRNTLNSSLDQRMKDMPTKYGPLVRVGPNQIISSNPDDWRKILGIRSKYVRSNWFDTTKFDGTSNVISEKDDHAHTILRGKLAPGYAGKENDSLEQSVDNSILNLIRLIEDKFLSTSSDYRPMDFAIKAQYLTLDIISDVAHGRPLGFLTQDKDLYSYIESNLKTFTIFNIIGVFPNVGKVLTSWIFKGLLPSPKDEVGFGRIMRVSNAIVAERFGPDPKVNRDMLGSFVRHGLSQKEIEAEAMIQMIAGSDTTATGMRTVLLHLITSPHAYAKLLAEISNATLSSPVKDTESRKLPYLQAVIKEGLRMKPPAGGLAYRVAPKGGDTLSGYYVPEGTFVGYNFFGLYSDKELWGEDADIFRPDRFLEGTKEEMKKMEINMEMIFSYGKWLCLGKNVAIMELNKVLIELLRRFDIQIVNPQNPWKSIYATVHVQSDMWVRFTRREQPL